MTQEALKALIHEMEYFLSCINEEKIPFDGDDFHEALRLGKEALAQPEQDSTYTYASSLATAIWQKHYMKESPKWKPLDTTEGVLTQIDNMTCGLIKEKPAQPEQEPVQWGVDWGKAGDIPCVSIIKRVPNGGIEVMAVEYAPYSYTASPQSTWVGLTDWEINSVTNNNNPLDGIRTFARAIEAKLKQKNGYAEEKK